MLTDSPLLKGTRMRARVLPRSRSIAVAAMAMLCAGALVAQTGQQPPAPVNASTDPMLRGFTFRSIGPAVMSGRIDDIEAVDNDPFTMYIGFATGGLWKTTTG